MRTAFDDWMEHLIGSLEHPEPAECGICGHRPNGVFQLCSSGTTLYENALLEQGRADGVEQRLRIARNIVAVSV